MTPAVLRCQSRRDGRGRTVVVHGLGEALPPLLKHLGINIQHLDARLAIPKLLSRMIQQSDRNVTCARQLAGQHTRSAGNVETLTRSAGNVKTLHPAVRVHLLDKVVLPQTMNAETHRIVHHVVRGGHRGEHALHCAAVSDLGRAEVRRTHGFLLGGGDRLESKVGLGAGRGRSAVGAHSPERLRARTEKRALHRGGGQDANPSYSSCFNRIRKSRPRAGSAQVLCCTVRGSSTLGLFPP